MNDNPSHELARTHARTRTHAHTHTQNQVI